MRIRKWLKNNTSSLCGKTIAISGSTGGIGRELCFYFAELGASLVLLDRNMQKSFALAEIIRKKYPSTSISHIQVDMSDISIVKAAADNLSELDIDFLVLNAGAYSIPRCRCDTGYDNVFQINFVSPYYLARRLLPNIRERGGRIIAVGSIAHNYSLSDIDDVDFSKRSRASLVYGNAKRYLMFSLQAISKTPNDVIIAHPGITPTNITKHYPKLIYAIIKYPMKLIFMPPRKASLSILAALFIDCDKEEWIGPKYFDIWGLPKRKKLQTCKEKEREQICDVAERIYSDLE